MSRALKTSQQDAQSATHRDEDRHHHRHVGVGDEQHPDEVLRHRRHRGERHVQAARDEDEQEADGEDAGVRPRTASYGEQVLPAQELPGGLPTAVMTPIIPRSTRERMDLVARKDSSPACHGPSIPVAGYER